MLVGFFTFTETSRFISFYESKQKTNKNTSSGRPLTFSQDIICKAEWTKYAHCVNITMFSLVCHGTYL